VILASPLNWFHQNRRWLAMGLGMVVPWLWLVGLDWLLRKKR
jgi:hypothetical protein